LRHAIAAERAQGSLASFYRYAFRRPIAPHIGLVIECLEAVESGTINRLVIVEPPGHAKSTVVSLAFTTWYLGRHPSHTLIGATTTAKLGELFTDSIAEMIERDDRYRAVFPKVRPDKKRGWSQEGLFVTRPWEPGQKDASLAFVGAGGPMIGRRADGLLLDDAVDEPTARSSVRLAARREWVQQTVRSRLKPNGWLVCAGTIWAEDDVIGTLSAMGTFVRVTMKAIAESRMVYASVEVPDGVAWAPRGAERVE